MDEAEFDKFADEYKALSEQVLGPSGEDSDFFAEYKARDTLQVLLKLKLPVDLKVLDFGSGVGTSVPWLRQYLPECELECVDISTKSLAIGKHRFPGMANFTHFDGKKLPINDASLDLVFSACVFHHIPPKDHPLLLTELHRVLSPGGLFISFEHNPFNPLTQRAVRACRYDENAILIRARDFKTRLKHAGFSKPQRCYRIFFPGFLSSLRPLEKYLTALPLGAQYYVYAQKTA